LVTFASPPHEVHLHLCGGLVEVASMQSRKHNLPAFVCVAATLCSTHH